MDRITLKSALDTALWMSVCAGEPDREISVEMRYKDLLAIRMLIEIYHEEKSGRAEE